MTATTFALIMVASAITITVNVVLIRRMLTRR